MSFNNVNVIKNGSQSRVLFDSFDKNNDVNPKTKKPGVRCHHWFTAFFLRIFGKIKIEDKKITGGKTIYLNKNSYNKWCERHRKEMNLPQGPTLPSANDIITHHKKLIKKQEEAANLKKQEEAANLEKQEEAANLKKQEEAANLEKQKKAAGTIKIQSLLRRHLIRKKFGNLKAIKIEIDSIKADIEKVTSEKEAKAKKHDEKISGTKKAIEDLESKKQTLENEIQELQAELIEKQALADNETEDDNALSNWFKKNIISKINKKKEDALKPLNVSQSEPISQSQLHTLQQEIQLVTSTINNKKESLKAYNDQIGNFEDQLENIYPQEKEEELKEIQDAIDEKEKDLAEKNKAYDELIIKMNSIGQTPSPSTPVVFKQIEEIEDSPPKMESTPVVTPDPFIPLKDPMEEVSTESAAQEEQTVTVNHIESLYSDVENYAHKKLKTLMKAIFDKFDKGIVKTWEFNPQTCEFKLILDKPGKLWVRPVKDNGENVDMTPKGVVFLIGHNDQREIIGSLEGESNTISFSKGFETFCEYKMKLFGIIPKSGDADGTIHSIQFSPENQNVTIIASCKDHFSGKKITKIEVRELRTLIDTWGKGEISHDDHENFLKAKQSNS